MADTAKQLELALRADPLFATLELERIDVAGVEAVVARLVPPERAVALWRAARGRVGPRSSVVLTGDDYVHADIEPLGSVRAAPLAAVRETRESAARLDDEARGALESLERASPQVEPYHERDVFLEDPEDAHISLVALPRPSPHAVLPFTRAGEGAIPRPGELVTMLRAWKERYGAEPLYADGDVLELEVQKPPSEVADLRAVARDFFLTSQGNREGSGIEEPARLLRRLKSDRWVLWWYGT